MSFPQPASEWLLGCFAKRATLSGSPLTARGHTRFTASITQRPSLPSLFPPRVFSPLHSIVLSGVLRANPHIVKMGAIPEVDPEEPVETKPFKFVTGKSSPLLPREKEGQSPDIRING